MAQTNHHQPQQLQLPIDGENTCMLCKNTPLPEETLTCKTCITPWHGNCLMKPPETLALTLEWDCPDCCSNSNPNQQQQIPVIGLSSTSGGSNELIAAIRGIEADETLTEQQKAKRKQSLLSGGSGDVDVDDDEKTKKKMKNKMKNEDDIDVLNIMDESFKCSFCMQLPERPVTTPCGHNFCLKCFQKWVASGKKTCAKCRSEIPNSMTRQPRINSALVAAIRMARTSKNIVSERPHNVYQCIQNQDKPDKAYTTERAKKPGKANACSGKIFVTIPSDHFGPIPAENDPVRNQGVLVGECWEDRMECRQWGAHFPHIAGIAGKEKYGAQSVALSGGYVDDEDHGEWFLYTGSGGRNLAGNKRTNPDQSFDQSFDKFNEALRVSCRKGYPVRVVRSHKEKRSPYAPKIGVRYDGVYRIEKCWRKVGVQGFKVCRYLFVRCDNEPAPWTSYEHGDLPRPLPVIKELSNAIDITERKDSPSWDYDYNEGRWKWIKPPPVSQGKVVPLNAEERNEARKAIRQSHNSSIRKKLLKGFSCQVCKKVLSLPVTTPCGHNFCKACLEGVFAGQSFVTERNCQGGRKLRSRKTVMKCPACPMDISDFLKNPQVNREMMDVIVSLKEKIEEKNEDSGEEGSRSTSYTEKRLKTESSVKVSENNSL